MNWLDRQYDGTTADALDDASSNCPALDPVGVLTQFVKIQLSAT